MDTRADNLGRLLEFPKYYHDTGMNATMNNIYYVH